MVNIIFETHATSKDNEAGLASGWYDVQLSELGRRQAREMGKRYKDKKLDAVFCSDLGRAYQTAALAFDGRLLSANPRLVFIDWRLRECDYGDFTRKPKSVLDKKIANRIRQPFPNGESLEDTNRRMASFLKDLKLKWDGKKVLIIGHRATHYGLDCLIAGKSLRQCIRESENWQWQPGWSYILK